MEPNDLSIGDRIIDDDRGVTLEVTAVQGDRYRLNSEGVSDPGAWADEGQVRDAIRTGRVEVE